MCVREVYSQKDLALGFLSLTKLFEGWAELPQLQQVGLLLVILGL